MATRFYLGSTATPAISPAFDSNWEQTGQAVRRKLYNKKTIEAIEALTDTTNLTIPITTTQDILGIQFISDPLPYKILLDARNWSMIIRCQESAGTANAHLAFSLRVLSNDGSAVRGTLRNSFTTITEFGTTANTKIIAAAAVTALTAEAGDRIVLETGIRASGPTAATTGLMRSGFSAASDFALTNALTTDLNPWCEFDQDLFGTVLNNYQFAKAGNNISVTERMR